MFEPKFNYSDKLVSNLINIERTKTEILRLDLSYNVRSKLTLNAKTLDMFHLANILGLDLTLKDAEKLALGKRPENITDNRAYVLTNFRNALEFSRADIADTYAEFDATVMLHLNKLVLTNWRETWEANFRKLDGKIIDDFDDDWAVLRDKSIIAADLEEQVSELIDWYKTVTPTISPLVRIALTISRLMELAPFYAGNKLTILAIADYLLYRNGFVGQTYNSTLQLFNTNKKTFIDSIVISRNSYELTFWMEELSKALLRDLNEMKEEINKFAMEDEKSKEQPFLDLSKRQLKILKYLQTIPTIQREDYCQMMEVSTMTAFRDLNDLVRKKLLKKDGQGRGTKYRLVSR